MAKLIADLAKSWQEKVSLEPVIFFFVFSNFVANGAQQNTNLLLRKICRDRVGHNFTTCLEHHNDPLLNLEVLKEANWFSLYLDLVGILPAVFYVVIGGALSDTYGKRKPLILLPLIGGLISNTAYIFISIFEEQLPLEIFFLTKMWEVCGGMPLYYLGVCSYAASRAKKNDRSTILARLDGVEQTSLILGVSVSPLAFNYWGYLGCFIFRVIGGLLAISYLVFVSPELPQRKVSDSREPIIAKESDEKSISQGVKSRFVKYIWNPITFAMQVLQRTDHDVSKYLLYLQIFNCSLYWFIMEEQNMLYFYMSRRFDGFDGADFAVYITSIKIAGIIGLLVFIPFFNRVAKLHESIILSLVTTLTTTSILISAFVDELYPTFYAIRLIGFLRPTTMSLARSLLARSVHSSTEIGRIYAVIGFITALLPFLSNPAYRFLFDQTASSFPQAIIVMAGSLSAITIIINSYLFMRRNELAS